MQTDWFRRLDGVSKDERRELIEAHAPALEILKQILEDRLSESVTKQQSAAAYGSPAWPYEQADANGQQRSLKYVLSLLDLTKDK